MSTLIYSGSEKLKTHDLCKYFKYLNEYIKQQHHVQSSTNSIKLLVACAGKIEFKAIDKLNLIVANQKSVKVSLPTILQAVMSASIRSQSNFVASFLGFFSGSKPTGNTTTIFGVTFANYRGRIVKCLNH